MLLRIDTASDRAIFEQIADSVRADIAEGHMRPGMTLAPAKQVAAALGVNVHTVLRAYQQLRDERLIDLRRGRGAVVTNSAERVVELHTEVARLVAHARELGVGPQTVAAMVASAAQRDASRHDATASDTRRKGTHIA